MTLRTAMVGYGKMGRNRHDAMALHGGFEVVAACDTRVDPQAGVPMVTDPPAVYDLNPDVIVGSVPNMMIPDVVCEALSRGKNVFAEKPRGRNSLDVRRMREAEAANPGLVQEFDFNHRMHDAIEEARKLVDAGTMGDICFMRGIHGKAGGPDSAQNWRNDTTQPGGSILIDQGIHMFDLFQMCAGRFPEVQSFVQRKFWTDLPVEDNAFALMKYAHGVVASRPNSTTPSPRARRCAAAHRSGRWRSWNWSKRSMRPIRNGRPS